MILRGHAQAKGVYLYPTEQIYADEHEHKHEYKHDHEHPTIHCSLRYQTPLNGPSHQISSA
jgi:hypothetical protein